MVRELHFRKLQSSIIMFMCSCEHFNDPSVRLYTLVFGESHRAPFLGSFSFL